MERIEYAIHPSRLIDDNVYSLDSVGWAILDNVLLAYLLRYPGTTQAPMRGNFANIRARNSVWLTLDLPELHVKWREGIKKSRQYLMNRKSGRGHFQRHLPTKPIAQIYLLNMTYI